ncbi:MAG: MucB/RseB C-terminal domain-containing protein [Burkholderiaceae bacterium]|nr:MucB/RseB C-terminal domain-containing protein [Burkholderiaceae bacterium]MCD8517565.1 MucB/RseB C-terminal domain-containing protein [Burkholderiaceae bacterium]MCD8537363.1 MucB/RseB C-terminal domain-containing protein [Burkholderiaceae bacterium]MCD8564579.1 MucB/RseB C-terminal domain-containing protein [Burkholderiaceae bacterium]
MPALLNLFGQLGLAVFVALALPLAAFAQQTGVKISAPELLQQVQQAAKTQNYQGIFAHQRNGQMRSFRVTHRFADGQEFERLEVLSDSPREYLRHNDRVQCLIPEQKLIVSEQQRQERFPALLMGSVSDLSQHYDFVLQERKARVAGRTCHRVSIVPKDDHRSRYELCVDDQTGLLLEAQMHDEQGSVVEHIAFTQLQVGNPIDQAELQPAWATDGWRVVERNNSNIDLKAMGWFYREPPGYRPVIEVERQFRDGRQVSQLILTDGLATISIFIEPYQQNLSQHQMSGASRSGAVNLYGKRHDDYWVMVAGEAPAVTVRQLAESIIRTGALHTK